MENKTPDGWSVFVLVVAALVILIVLGIRGDSWRNRYCDEALNNAATGADSIAIYQDVPECLERED